MKFNKFIILLVMFSCNNKQISIVKKITKDSQLKFDYQDSLVYSSIDKIYNINRSKKMNEIFFEGKKKDTLLHIEGLENLLSNEKHIEYIKLYNKDDVKYIDEYSFLLNKKNNIILSIYYICEKTSSNSRDEKKDTFFFKNNKIYFWKNKQATKEELLKKEKEILAIKKEIDSIMEW